MHSAHLAFVITALLPTACLKNSTDLSDTSGDATTTTGDTSSTSTGESSSTTTGDTSTTQSDPCDDDPACGPGEDLETCPEQCSVCGDGVVSGTETCDNGPDNQTYWPATPPADACSDTCTNTLESCGDALQNGPESCDNGTNTDPDYTPAPPPASACAPGCLLPAYCGDALLSGPEICDDAAQTATCELTCLTPTCGDGTHNPLAAEACDDANTQDGDGCSADCKSIERFVFATSATYFGDLNQADGNPEMLSGLSLADARCQELAEAALLPGSYKAWLSTAAASPSTRFDTAFTGLYHLPKNGSIVAMGWKDLISGTLLHAIDSDESGTTIQGNVWTNTLPDGSKADGGDCAGWTANDDTTTTIGKSSAIDLTWTNLNNSQLCSSTFRLYCIENP